MLVMVLALAMAGFGFFLLLVAIVLLNTQRRSRLQLGRLRRQVERVEDAQQSSAEKAARRRRIEVIEAQKRTIHGRYDSGC